MPQFKNPGAQEEYQAKMEAIAEWRLGVLADVVWLAMPFYNTDTWDDIAERAVSIFEINGVKEDDPMFREMGYSDGFVNARAIVRRSADIVNKLAEEGRFVYSQPFEGVRKAHSPREIEETMEYASRRINGCVNNYNHRAEYANTRRNTELGLYQVTLLPAQTNGGD